MARAAGYIADDQGHEHTETRAADAVQRLHGHHQPLVRREGENQSAHRQRRESHGQHDLASIGIRESAHRRGRGGDDDLRQNDARGDQQTGIADFRGQRAAHQHEDGRVGEGEQHGAAAEYQYAAIAEHLQQLTALTGRRFLLRLDFGHRYFAQRIRAASAGSVKAAVSQNTARSEMYWPQAPISAAPKPLPIAA